ncbi:MAG: tetratricopeptide repeat protein, partial [Sulfuricurvum sp.]|uniref:tetratricopeptide repeat protein n=1 Tax=Sulfuricurvum sp. TaxID=2025608 RepID=UPI002628D939
MDTTENDTLQLAIYKQALALYQEGKCSEVLSGMDRIIPEALSALFFAVAGSCAHALGRYDEAEHHWRSAISMQKDYIDAYNDLGILFKTLKRFDESESMFSQAIKLAPQDPKLYNNIANLFRETECFEKAETGYKKAVQLDPQYTEAYRNLGMMYKALHRYEEAETAYKEALKITPDC